MTRREEKHMGWPVNLHKACTSLLTLQKPVSQSILVSLPLWKCPLVLFSVCSSVHLVGISQVPLAVSASFHDKEMTFKNPTVSSGKTSNLFVGHRYIRLETYLLNETRCQSLHLTGTWQVGQFQGWAPLTLKVEFTDLWPVSSFGVFLTWPVSARFPWSQFIMWDPSSDKLPLTL